EAAFFNPMTLTRDVAGNTYVVDFGNCSIRKITPDGTVTTLAGHIHLCDKADGVGSGGHFNQPAGVAVGTNGLVYVSDYGTNVIKSIAPDGTVTTIAGSSSSPAGGVDGVGAVARFNSPADLLALPSGDILVADVGNYAIRRIAPDNTVTTAYGT